MANKRITDSLLPNTYQDGEILYGQELRKIVGILKSASNADIEELQIMFSGSVASNVVHYDVDPNRDVPGYLLDYSDFEALYAAGLTAGDLIFVYIDTENETVAVDEAKPALYEFTTDGGTYATSTFTKIYNISMYENRIEIENFKDGTTRVFSAEELNDGTNVVSAATAKTTVDRVNQDVKTTASPTFASVKVMYGDSDYGAEIDFNAVDDEVVFTNVDGTVFDYRIDQSLRATDDVEFNSITAPSLVLENANGNATAYIDDNGIVRFDYAGVSHELGENLFVRVTAIGTINEGDVVMFAGTIGASGKIQGKTITATDLPTIKALPRLVLGIATETITDNNRGRVNWYGAVSDYDTSMYAETDILYVDMVNGGLTNVEPAKPNPVIRVAVVEVSHQTQGKVLVRPDFSTALGSVHDVEITSEAIGDIIVHNGSHWVNANFLEESNTKIKSSFLPSYVDDILEYADFASLPAEGEVGKIYVTLDDNGQYRWSGSAYININGVASQTGTSTTAFNGILSSTDTDVQKALDTIDAHEHNYSDLNNIPSTFTPSEHNHDDRYYTETELLTTGVLDDRYYTETELLTDGVLDARYYTESEINTKMAENTTTLQIEKFTINSASPVGYSVDGTAYTFTLAGQYVKGSFRTEVKYNNETTGTEKTFYPNDEELSELGTTGELTGTIELDTGVALNDGDEVYIKFYQGADVVITAVDSANTIYDNTTSGLTATNVQDAIDEVDENVDTIGQKDGLSTAIGFEALNVDDGTDNKNTAFGYSSLFSNTTGIQNTANGHASLYLNTTGSRNTANGYESLFYNTTGYHNTATGYASLQSNTTGYQNVATGYASLHLNTTGNENTASGYESLKNNTAGSANTAVGYQSLYLNTTGTYNTSSGMYSLFSNTTGIGNTATGYASLQSNTTGHQNTANGYQSLYSNTAGYQNTANGAYSLHLNTTGVNNTASGYSSLNSNTTGSNNTAIGRNAGRYIADGATGNTTSDYGTYIGYDTRAGADNNQNETVIGNGAIGNGSNTVTLGNTSVTAVYKGDEAVACFDYGTDTFTTGTTHTVTDTFITANTYVTVTPTGTPAGSWSVESFAGYFTITSDTTEASVAFEWNAIKGG